MTPYEVVTGKFGKRLVMHSAWTEGALHTIQKEGIVEIELNYAKGWNDQNLDFVTAIPSLLCIDLLDWSAEGIKALESMRELRSIRLSTYTDESIDFTVFPNLIEVRIEWNSGFKSALEVKGLQVLSINRPPKRYIERIEKLVNLRELSLLSCSAESLDGFRALTKLEYLRLIVFQNLENISFLSSLKNLKEIWAQNTSGMWDLTPLVPLKKLEVLTLESCGPYESVEPLLHLPSLKTLVLIGRNTLFQIGSLEDLKQLPNISFVHP